MENGGRETRLEFPQVDENSRKKKRKNRSEEDEQ